MALIDVVQQVCQVVGVEQFSTVFGNLPANRTQQEMLALANEMAQRIAYDTREWTALKVVMTQFGDGASASFPLPANYKRMLLSSNIWRTSTPAVPMRFFPDTDEWLQRRARNYSDSRGEWTIYGGQLHIVPTLAVGDSVMTPYLDKNCIAMTGASPPVPPTPPPPVTAWANGTHYLIGDLARNVGSLSDIYGNTIWSCLQTHFSPASGTFTQNRTSNPGFWAQVADPNPLPWAYTTWYGTSAQARDTVDNTIWSCLINHLTPASGTFAENRATNPGFWSLVPPPVPVPVPPVGLGDRFLADGDTFRLDERLLKLGMIWQWKANKGSPYAEDMASYETAIARVAGADEPAPIIVDGYPISQSTNATVAYPWPVPTP